MNTPATSTTRCGASNVGTMGSVEKGPSGGLGKSGLCKTCKNFVESTPYAQDVRGLGQQIVTVQMGKLTTGVGTRRLKSQKYRVVGRDSVHVLSGNHVRTRQLKNFYSHRGSLQVPYFDNRPPPPTKQTPINHRLNLKFGTKKMIC